MIKSYPIFLIGITFCLFTQLSFRKIEIASTQAITPKSGTSIIFYKPLRNMNDMPSVKTFGTDDCVALFNGEATHATVLNIEGAGDEYGNLYEMIVVAFLFPNEDGHF